MAKRNSLTNLLWELVAIPSINPSLDHEGIGCGEEPVATNLQTLAEKKGLEVYRQAVLPGRENLIIRLTPSGKVRQKILLAPHLDVVPAPLSSFSPKISKGRLHGRGACDTKASVACFFHALTDLADSPQRPKETEISLVGLVDEEFAQSGSRKFAKVGPKGDLAIVGEPTQLQVITAHKGSLWIQLKTLGKSAHGATPEKGINAIEAMQRVLGILYHEYPRLLSRRMHPLLGQATLSVGAIHGGSQPNVVPDLCRVDLDRRTLPGESVNGIIQELEACFSSLGAQKPEVRVSRTAPCPPLQTDPDLPLVRLFLQKVGRRKSQGVPYFTDASPVAMGGTPAIVFGPGNIDQAHSRDEWVSLEEVERGHAKILHFLQSLP
jgi:acetylornithine deacetylase/succinyl-diaminopimelate desuccinylase-like protein